MIGHAHRPAGAVTADKIAGTLGTVYGLDAAATATILKAVEFPVIAISANVLAETMTRGQSSGFQGYLTKPISIGALVSAIQEATARAQASDALTA